MKQTQIKWLREEDAARMMGYNSILWFRRLVKERKLEVDYTRVRRMYLYSEDSINKELMRFSTVSR